MNNFVVAQELIHSMGRKNRRTIFFALKVDMSKAYDKVEWLFICLDSPRTSLFLSKPVFAPLASK